MGGSLALEGVCKFFPIFKFQFWFTFIYRRSNHLSPQNTPRSLQFRDSNHVLPAYFTFNQSIYLIIQRLNQIYPFNPKSRPQPLQPHQNQNPLKCPYFSDSIPQMINYTSEELASIVAHLRGQI
uniref:Uncharacterized protein n=1 Tax=Siphoviridae sp. ctOCb13 TaxID=2825477 RepID=A0A8S5Q0H8_9CAUD|nr:MAG TPA: hypothetical protein [Siphoviridae sp. ctOCb13]